MTWSARTVVTSVEPTRDASNMIVQAHADVDAITSNSKIAEVDVRLRIDGTSAPLKPGDEVLVNGHFKG